MADRYNLGIAGNKVKVRSFNGLLSSNKGIQIHNCKANTVVGSKYNVGKGQRHRDMGPLTSERD